MNANRASGATGGGNKGMITKTKMGLVAGLALLPTIAVPAAATPVVGQFSLSGYVQANGSVGMGGATGISFANASGTSATGNSGVITSYGAGSGAFSALGACASTTSGCGTTKNIVSFSTPEAITSFLALAGGPAVLFDLTGISTVTRNQDGSGGSLTFTAPGTINFAGYDPTPGIFAFTAQGNNITSYSAALRALPVVAAVPEPASWAMMIGGFGVAGGTLRRRKKVAKKVAFAA